jgi:hypothetical protein
MSLATARQDRANLNEYEFLQQAEAEIVARTSEWMNRLQVLFGAVAAGDKPDVQALRTQMIADLRAVLGV